MSKSSTATSRQAPVQTVSSVAAGGLVIHAENLVIETHARLEIIDLTDRLMAHVARVPVREGLMSVCSLHTTCALLVNEAQPALLADFRRFLETLVPSDGQYLHNDPAHSDCSRGNADAHLRALLLSHSATLQVSGGELVLGHWQRVLMVELDGPRARTLRVQVLGG